MIREANTGNVRASVGASPILMTRLYSLSAGGVPPIEAVQDPSRLEVNAVPSNEQLLLNALAEGAPAAPRQLYDTYADYVDRVLFRILGPDDDIPDLIQEVFLSALANHREIEKAESLKHWLASIAVFKARSHLRRLGRRRRLWGLFFWHADRDIVYGPDSGDAMAADALRRVLDQMSANLRVPFALRHLEGMQLEEIAKLCRMSLATVKRRLASAESRFLSVSRKDPDLWNRLRESEKWKNEIEKLPGSLPR